jgi:SpoIIAA-like
MIEALEGMPEGTIGFRASGRVSGDEYREVLLPAVQQAAESGEIRLVFAIDSDFEEFEPGALWEDTKVGVRFGLGHHSAWQRCALATDVEWIVKSFHFFAWMAPGEVRTFALDELEDAKAWAAG